MVTLSKPQISLASPLPNLSRGILLPPGPYLPPMWVAQAGVHRAPTPRGADPGPRNGLRALIVKKEVRHKPPVPVRPCWG